MNMRKSMNKWREERWNGRKRKISAEGDTLTSGPAPQAYETELAVAEMCGFSKDVQVGWPKDEPFSIKPIRQSRAGDQTYFLTCNTCKAKETITLTDLQRKERMKRAFKCAFCTEAMEAPAKRVTYKEW